MICIGNPIDHSHGSDAPHLEMNQFEVWGIPEQTTLSTRIEGSSVNSEVQGLIVLVAEIEVGARAGLANVLCTHAAGSTGKGTKVDRPISSQRWVFGE
jgi:hypothetical protein